MSASARPAATNLCACAQSITRICTDSGIRAAIARVRSIASPAGTPWSRYATGARFLLARKTSDPLVADKAVTDGVTAAAASAWGVESHEGMTTIARAHAATQRRWRRFRCGDGIVSLGQPSR